MGCIARYSDAYGNTHDYSYEDLPLTGSDTIVSLTHVRCHAAPKDAESDPQLQAHVVFIYDTGEESGHTGRLLSVEAYRPNAGGGSPAEIITNRVFYTYHDGGETTEGEHDSGNQTEWLGTAGDLIQVRVDERVDPAPGSESPDDPVWYSKITQYRYHTGGAAESGDADSDGWPTEWGGQHQLKMVINPQQIEFYAQLRADSTSSSAGTSVADYASHLFTLEDGQGDTAANGLKPVNLAAKIIPNYYHDASTYLDGRVETEVLLTGCGCSTGGTQGIKEDYEYVYSDEDEQRTTIITESRRDGSSWEAFRRKYSDLVRVGVNHSGQPDTRGWYLQNDVVTGAGEESPYLGMYWVTHYEHSSDGRNTLTRKMMPSAMDSYVPFHLDEMDEPVAPSYTAKSNGGLVYAFGHNELGRTTEIRVHQGVPSGDDFGDADAALYYLVEQRTYGTALAGQDHLIVQVDRVRTEGQTELPEEADDVETTSYEYSFHDGTNGAVAWVKTTVEAETTDENGPGGTYSSWEIFDPRGLNVWNVAADGARTKQVFDNDAEYPVSVSRTGQVVATVRNADDDNDGLPDAAWMPGSLPADRNAEETAGYESLMTSVTRDVLGRVQATTSPGGQVHATTREMRVSPDRPGILYYAMVKLPYQYGTGLFDGAATVQWMDAGGRAFASQDFTLAADYGETDPEALYRRVHDEYTLAANPVARQRSEQHVTGLVEAVRVWHRFAKTVGMTEVYPDGYYDTTYEYDSQGRVSTMRNGVGTLTRTTYDLLDRPKVTSVAVEVSSPSTPAWTVVETKYYDSAWSGSAEVENVGDGNLTLALRPVDGTSGHDRKTRTAFDWRNRPVGVLRPAAPHVATKYDNLGRAVLSASLVGASASTDWESTDSDRDGLTRRSYSQRGSGYRTEAAISPATSVSGTSWLSSDRWLDAVGREVGARSPGVAARKTTYDGLGRPTVSYAVDNAGFGAYSAVTASNATVIGEHIVLEQLEYRYVLQDSACKGLPDLARTRQRTHTYTGVGALAEGTNAVTSYVGYFYDGAGRKVSDVDYGTTLATFSAETVSSEPNPDQASPPSTGTTSVMVNVTAFDDRGNVACVTDNGGTTTRFLYDALGRQYATIENFVDASVEWGEAGDGDRWIASGVGTTDGTDRVTTTVFDASSHVVKYVAHRADDADPGDRDEVTSYVFGVSSEETPPSSLASNDLLRSVTYPDAGVVGYGYNRQGELVQLKDQNATEHTYTRDALGRVTLDDVTAFGGSSTVYGANSGTDIGAVLSIEWSYTAAGLLERVTSNGLVRDPGDLTAPYDLIPGIVNEVKIGYTALHQVELVWQDQTGTVEVVSGAPAGDTRLVKYTYETQDSTEGNFSRPTSVDYPRNKNTGSPVTASLDYLYDSALDDSISRVDHLKSWVDRTDDATDRDLVLYDYIGLGVFAQVDFPSTTDMQLDYSAFADGQRHVAGQYPGLDGFGRVIRQDWVDGDFGEGTNTGYPSRPQAVAIGYAYDAGGNRTRMVDQRVQGTTKHSFSYGYDGLHRLTSAEHGTWNGSAIASPWGRSEQWTLDPLGNWEQWKRDENGNHSYSAAETEVRTHNEVNELESRSANSSTIEDLAYDAEGNLGQRVAGSLYTVYVHDAWNRLVGVSQKDGAEGTPQPRIAQEFNGLNWRTMKRVDTLGPVTYDEGLDDDVIYPLDGVLDQVTYYSYDASWRIVDERIDEQHTEEGSPTDRRLQHIWGLRYIDDIVLTRVDTDADAGGDYESAYYHLTDAMFSTVMLVSMDTAGYIESVSYDPYGRPSAIDRTDLNNDGVTDGSDLGLLLGAWGKITGDVDYISRADLNRDGTIDGTDLGAFFGGWGAALPPAGCLSRVDNDIGFDGYVHDSVTQCSDYHTRACGLESDLVRNRTYDPVLGRWAERDPAGYSEGPDLYLAFSDLPTSLTDPSGLASTAPSYNLQECKVVILFGDYQEQKDRRIILPPDTSHCAIGELCCWGDSRNCDRQPDGTLQPKPGRIRDFPGTSGPIYYPSAKDPDGLKSYEKDRQNLPPELKERGFSTDPGSVNGGNGPSLEGFQRHVGKALQKAIDQATAFAADCDCKCDSIMVQLHLVTSGSTPNGTRQRGGLLPAQRKYEREQPITCQKRGKSSEECKRTPCPTRSKPAGTPKPGG